MNAVGRGPTYTGAMRLCSFFILAASGLCAQPRPAQRFEVSWAKPLDGHVVVILSTNNSQEPRFAVSEGLGTQQMFGVASNVAVRNIEDGSPASWNCDIGSALRG